MVSRVDLKPSQVWAVDAIKVYDGANKTNIVIKWGEGMDPSKFTVEFAADASAVADETRTAGFTMVRPVDAPEDTEFSADFKGYQDSCTNKVWFRVTEKENYSEGDEKGNYSNYYGYAWVKIAPRPVHFSFPKAVKPYDGNTTYSTGLSTNLVKATHGEPAQGPDHGMVGSEKFNCTATGSFTGSNVKDAADYFQLGTVTIAGERNAFKRNYVITYDGEADQLVPGAITALPIEPVEPADPSDNPDDEPDPTDDPTIWARNVVKCYDGIGTNVIAKVYNAVDGNTFTYEYSTNKIDFVAWDALQFTNVVAGQKVWYRAMTAKGDYIESVKLNYTNEYDSLSMLDVGEYEGMISTNDEVDVAIVIRNAAGDDVTANYVMGFMPGKLTVEAAGLAVTAESVTNCYDKTTNRLENYTITDKQSGTAVTPTEISNSVDGVTWYLKDDFPLYVDVTNEAPVWVAVVADNYTTFVSEGPLAYVTVTQKVLTVTLNNTNKVYGTTTPDWTVKNVEGLVGDDQLMGAPGTIIGPEPKNASDTPYTVTVGAGTLSAGGNYTIVVKKPTIKITPMPIIPDDDVVLLGGNTPEDIEEYMAGVPAGTLVAFRTEVWTNDVPEVTTVGTNIVARFKGHTAADTANASFEWSTTGETGPWSPTAPNFTEICASQVWCKVTSPNYVATNAFSYVYIKSRESKPDDKDAEPEDKLQDNPATAEQTEKVVEAIAANDNRNPGYDPTKPVWDGEGTMSGGDHGVQTDAKVNLKVTSIGNLPEDEKEKAEDHLAEEIANAQKRSDVDPESVKGRNVDVKLLYTRTYSDGTKGEPVNIGASNEEIIPFTIAVDLADDEELLCVVRYHGESRKEFYAGKGTTTEHFELSADRKYVTVYAKTYSEFILITGVIGSSPCTGCPFGYQIKVALKTTSAQSIKDVLPEGKACESGCLRSPATRRLAGFIYGNTEATEGSGPCGEKETGCGCNAWDNAKLLLWDYDTKADARPATASILQLDRIFSRVGAAVHGQVQRRGADSCLERLRKRKRRAGRRIHVNHGLRQVDDRLEPDGVLPCRERPVADPGSDLGGYRAGQLFGRIRKFP